jgi:hypothetical protein
MGRCRRWDRVGALASLSALTMLLAGCAQLSFFPRTTAGSDGHTLLGRATGRLILDHGCIWLASGDQRDLLIWGPEFAYTSSGAGIEITRNGAVVARVGREITVSGGEFSRGETRPPADIWIESQIGQAIPSACRQGMYWVVGDVVAP